MLILLAVTAAAVIRTLNVFELIEERNAYEERLKSLQATLEERRAELELVDSPEYLEQQARSQLGMIFEGEILYKPRPNSGYVPWEEQKEEVPQPSQDEDNSAKPH